MSLCILMHPLHQSEPEKFNKMYSCFSFDKFLASVKSFSQGDVADKRNGNKKTRMQVFICKNLANQNQMDRILLLWEGVLLENMVG